MKKKIAIIAAIIVTMALSIGVAACNITPSTQKGAPSGFIAIDINPSVELTSDNNGKVTTVRAANEDARVLLSGTDLKGMSVKEASKTVTALAEEMGYLERSQNKVSVLAAAENGQDDELLNAAKEGIAEGSDKAQISDQVKSLEREVKKLKEANPELYKDLTPAKLRLIYSIQGWDQSFKTEQGAAMSVDKLKDILDDLSEDFEDFVSDELEDKFENLYDQKKEEILIKIDAVYGEEYAALASLARQLEKKADAFEDALENAELSMEDATALAEILALESTDALKDENGTITVKSAEAYIEALEDEWDNADSEDEEMEDKLDAAEEILERYDEEEASLSAEMTAEIAALFESAGREMPAITNAEELEEYAEDVLEEELETMKDSIVLTEEQKEQIKAYEAEMKAAKDEIKESMKAEIDAAKEKLKEQKDQLLGK